MGTSMLEEMKKKSVKAIMPISILLIVVGVVLLAVFGPDFFTYVKGPVDFNTLTMDEIDNQFVKIDYNFSYGTFAEETTTRTRNGVKVSEGVTSRMNIVLISGVDHYFEKENDGFRYMGICFEKKDFSKADRVDENVIDFFNTFEEWYYDSSITNEELLGTLKDHYEFTGQIVKMTDEMYAYYKEFFLDEDYTLEEIEEYCSPYYIKVGYMKHGEYGLVIFLTILGLILTVIGILVIVRAVTGGFQKKLIKELNKSAFGLSRVESDFQSAVTLCKGYKIGREYLYVMGAGSSVHLLSEFLWAYIHQTTHKTYFITTGKSFSVNVCKDNKKSFMINVKNNAEATSVLETLQKACPGLILGYSDEAAKIYRTDIQQMIRYREEKRAEAGVSPKQTYEEMNNNV